MEERSLDEFVEAGEAGSDSSGDDETARVPPGSVEPAAVTSRVVPDGTPCEGCGERVSRLWTSEDGERCRDCKEW